MSSTAQTQEYKISLWTAILININIMLGAGIFINMPELAKKAGVLSGGIYIIIGLLMLPLILSIAQLLRLHPAGGFYSYAQKEISPFIGFVSGWSYFTSKLASSIVMINTSVILIQAIIPWFAKFSTAHCILTLLTLFIALNMLNIKAGSAIQSAFIAFKTIPIIFAILTGILLLQPAAFSSAPLDWSGITLSLPLVIYAVLGFEAACSVSNKIKDAQKNAPLAVLISFGVVITIATLYQTILYGALADQIPAMIDYRNVFPTLLNRLFAGNVSAIYYLERLFHLAIASSTLGAAYGIIFSNCWNLYVLAEHKHVFGWKLFTKLNKNMIPYLCVLAEGVICVGYLYILSGYNYSPVPLQQTAALGCVISYTLSVLALLYAQKNHKTTSTYYKWVAILGLASCGLLIAACINSFFAKGMSSLLIFAALTLLGIVMYFVTRKAK